MKAQRKKANKGTSAERKVRKGRRQKDERRRKKAESRKANREGK